MCGAEKNVGIGGRDGCSTRDKKTTTADTEQEQSTNKLCVESWWDEKYNKNAKNKSRSERHSKTATQAQQGKGSRTNLLRFSSAERQKIVIIVLLNVRWRKNLPKRKHSSPCFSASQPAQMRTRWILSCTFSHRCRRSRCICGPSRELYEQQQRQARCSRCGS